MIIYHQNNVGGFAGAHIWYSPLQTILTQGFRVAVSPAVGGGRIMSSLAASGGLAGAGGLAGTGGGLAA